MKTLTLNLKAIYFDEIKSEKKLFEYRLMTPYWKKRLLNKDYDNIVLKSGYPAKENTEKHLTRVWNGYEIQKITHPHFGTEEVTVFAIKVN